MLTKFSHEQTQPFYLSVAKGEVNNHSSINKFGATPAMSQNQTGTIWDVNDTLYPWSSFATAAQVTIPTVNASDSGNTITLQGLDANYVLQTETITLSSSSSVTSTKSFIRLFRAYYNGLATNVGAILVQISGVTVLKINAGQAQTLMCVYTVPAGYTGYLLVGTASCEGNADASGSMYVRYFGQDSFRIGHTFEVSGVGGPYEHTFAIPVVIPEKSDIDVRATVRSNNARITAAFDMLLVKN